MNRTLTYLLFLIVVPAAAFSQTHYKTDKEVMVGGTRLNIYDDEGVCLGSNPIFLVPIDTLGNVSFTGVINNVKVMGKFALYPGRKDTVTIVEDSEDGHEIMICRYFAKKHGTWSYYYNYGFGYHEYYNMGEMVKRDTLEGVLKSGNREIKIADSMAHIRSMVDLYLIKGYN